MKRNNKMMIIMTVTEWGGLSNGVNFISIYRLLLVGPIGQEIVVAISNVFDVVYDQLLAPM